MIKSITLSVFAPLAGLLLAGAAVAQVQTIDGTAVPADQTQAVQEWCEELQAQQGLTGTNEPESTMTQEQVQQATGSAATTTSTDADAATSDMAAGATTDTSADASTDAAAGATTDTTAGATTDTQASGADAATTDSTFDVSTVTLEQCQEGGFTQYAN